MKTRSLIGFLFLLASIAIQAEADSPLLQSNDRVVLVGNTLIERARLYGHIETAIQLAAGPEIQNLTFRNLGWSADSVFNDSRAYFGTPKDGQARLDKDISEIQPSVVLFCYGTGEAMSVSQGWTDDNATSAQSAGGLESSRQVFIDGYQVLINRIDEQAGEGLREKVFIAPPPLENLGGYLPDQTENNSQLSTFRDAIRELAERNDGRFVDLFHALGGDSFDGSPAAVALTNNGLHHTEAGYQIVARELIKELGYDETVFVNPDNQTVSTLRDHIIEKNRLFFNRWRPTNETYLFLFRAHEQGQNAKEIPMFDPIIQEEEKKISHARNQVFQGQLKD